MPRTLLPLLLLLACLAAAPAAAQTSGAPPERLAAAIEMLEAMNTPAEMEAGMEMMLQQQMEMNPMLASMEGVMRDFLSRHMSWDALREPLGELYAERMTAEEMRAVTAFYRSPAGRRLADLAPELGTAAGELGERQVMDNAAELQRMIMDHLAQMEDGKAKP